MTSKEDSRSVDIRSYIDHDVLKAMEEVNRPIHIIAFSLCLFVMLGCATFSIHMASNASTDHGMPPFTVVPCIILQGFMHLNCECCYPDDIHLKSVFVSLFVDSICLVPAGYSGIILQHEIVHDNVLPWERYLEVLYGLLTPFSPAQFTRWHMDHHRHLLSPINDPKRAYLSPKASLNADTEKKTSTWTKMLYFTPALIVIYFRASSKAATAHEYSTRLMGKIRGEKLRTFVFHCLIGTYVIFSHGIKAWMVAHCLPLTIGFPIAFAINRLGQHYDVDESKEYHIGTRVDGSFIWHLLFLNSNFHIEHHWFPKVPFYRLKQLNHDLRPFFAAEGIPNYTYGQLLFCWFVENAAPHSHWDRSALNHSRKPGLVNTIKVLLELSRIETALPVIVSVCCGYGRALLAMSRKPDFEYWDGIDTYRNLFLLLGSAVCLNCASNILNQWTDIVNDKINKPNRPIIRGDASQYETAFYGFGFFGLSLYLAWYVVPVYLVISDDAFTYEDMIRKRQVFLIILLAGVTTASYSFPSLGRFKSNAWTASGCIALARGLLLSVVGSAAVVDVIPNGDSHASFTEAWLIGLVLAIFLFGAAVTKDFTDVQGDKAANCQTLPVLYGKEGTVIRIAPFFVIPWCLLYAARSLLHAEPRILSITASTLISLSVTTLYLLGADSSKLVSHSCMNSAKEASLKSDGMHVAWKLMYVIIMVFHVGTLTAYAMVV